MTDDATGVARRSEPANARCESMIRVDHAGEYGAARIYAGQLAVLGRSGSADTLQQMQAQEQEHLDGFAELVVRRRVRPTALLPFWHLAGFALGAVTAAMGERAAMACTVAVEEAIDVHYAGQIAALDDSEAELRATIARYREDELHHRDVALAHGARQAPGYPAAVGGDQGRLPRRHRGQREGLTHLIHRIAGIRWRAWYNVLESLRVWVLTPTQAPGQNLPCPPLTTIRCCHSRCQVFATRR